MVSRNSVINICKHELGHWLTAQHYNDAPEYIEINGGPNGLSGNSYSVPRPDLPSKASVLEFLKNRIAVLIAGVVSETYKRDFSPEQLQDLYVTTAAVDVERSYVLLHMARGIQFSGKMSEKNQQQQLDRIHQECWDRAEKIISKNSDKIEYLAIKMADKFLSSSSGTYKFTKPELLGFIADFKKKT
ncbi:TPA: hypothetical protein L3M66_004783 [Vibrio parahaemolyticus]|uniref:hypothetical protein n=1 Tax=Vibrio parahaemolyticus TaxID=670 RepID=UPI001121E632|nr:hypothetical protein [Vibrio parahaemolyticus]TOB15023.1 hypothetical protein CGK10_23875 [Vibrio parahaemolyticus]HBN6206101.1 hypothetical protein [Vibrio parahaemolyticus]